MRTDQPQTIRLQDYTGPAFTIHHVDLTFDLEPSATKVEAVLDIERQTDRDGVPLVLDGENMVLDGVALDGREIDRAGFSVTDEDLTIPGVPDKFKLTIRTTIDPKANTALEGLYQSKSAYCTQCEPEGFRRITYFLDRPDVMATYKVTIRADKKAAPVLLSNGNNTSSRDLDGGRHEKVWEDPFPKPSYLFALVAGDLAVHSDTFTTKSGRVVDLHIYVEHGNENRCAYAMDSLKRSMKWDEDRFGLEYDLDIFNIVAVSDFNMGAMENKSLNVFNAKFILADPETATDQDFANIEAIVAHEYFHNWTGNRVTCRDWFQLSLKEGLTVFRDQEFTSDQRSRPVKRIQDVRMLRARQFPEDAGPLAHPIRPDQYIEINNFYTATVYEKGAEVIRMLHTLLGEEGFQRGMKLYFERHDGQAVTCDDFTAAMADANDIDLTQFKIWYSQAGTPEVTAKGAYEPVTRKYTLSLSQQTKPTPGQENKKAAYIPLRIGLIGSNGGDMPMVTKDPAVKEDGVVHLTEPAQAIVFEDVAEEPVLSLNRGFSAPIISKLDQADSVLSFRMAHDADPFARWEAGQQYATRLIIDMANTLAKGGTPEPDTAFAEAVANILRDDRLDPAFKASALALPTEDFVGEQMPVVLVDEIHEARMLLRKLIRSELSGLLQDVYDANRVSEPFAPTAEQAGRRALRNNALAYLCVGGDGDAPERAKTHFDEADNMTDLMAGLTFLADMDHPHRDAALTAFHDRFKDNEQVMDKWLSIQAMASRPDTLEIVKGLKSHPVFSMRNPNKVRALISAFVVVNAVRFHAKDGSGYTFLGDNVIELDPMNPQVAARLLGPLGNWRRFDKDRQQLMKAQLERVLATEGLSNDSYEIASKSLK